MSILASYLLPHPPLAIPEIGKGKEAMLPSVLEAFRSVGREIASLAPDTIIIATPHAESYSDYIQLSDGEVGIGSMHDFGHREINYRFLYDRELSDAISSIASLRGFPAGSEGGEDMALDHGTMVPLYFINQYYSSYKVVRMGLSGLSSMDHYHMGMIIREAVERLGRKAVFIASGDLSHVLKDDGPYGRDSSGEQYDQILVNSLKQGDFATVLNLDPAFVRKAKVCGHRAFAVLMGTLDGKKPDIRFYGYENAFGIGYASFAFHPKEEDPSRNFMAIYLKDEKEKAARKNAKASPYVRLCLEALRKYLAEGKIIRVPADFPPEGKSKGSCFVTVYLHDQPHGCIGTIQPTKRSLGEEIIANAIEAATDDPRYLPIKPDDLDYVTFKVDAVRELEDCLESDLNPKKYGLVVSYGPRRGVLLPNLPEIEDVQSQIEVAREKAGIAKSAHLTFQRFKITTYR